jgi:hypothetical protein
MANGRFVSTSIANDQALASLSMEAELIYLKTIPHLDRDGLITGVPGSLLGRLIERAACDVANRSVEVTIDVQDF